MSVRKAILPTLQPLVAVRRPSFRASRQLAAASLYELFGGAEGQPFASNIDTVLRIKRPMDVKLDAAAYIAQRQVFRADLQVTVSDHVSRFADCAMKIQVRRLFLGDARLQIGQRWSRRADLALGIGGHIQYLSDVGLTIYRVLLHEGHFILT